MDLQKRNNLLLVKAFEENNLFKVKQLLKNGANPDVIDNSERTLLMNAAKENNSDLVKILLKYGANHSITDKREGFNAFLNACSTYKFGAARLLLAAGADISSVCKNKANALMHFGCAYNVGFFCRHGIDINARDNKI